MKLTKEQKARYKRIHSINEAKNYHSENAIMLIKLFGTKEELKKANEIQKKHLKQGSLTHEQASWLYQHGYK